MRMFRAALVFCMRARWLVIAVTVGLFAASLYGYGFIQQQFFPASDRPELVVDLTLPQDSSIYATEHEVERFEALLKDDPNIEHYSFYVGQGAVRFYLPLNVQLSNDYFAQAVIVTKGIEEREIVRARLQKALDTEFASLNSRIYRAGAGTARRLAVAIPRQRHRPRRARATPRSWSPKRSGRTRTPG